MKDKDNILTLKETEDLCRLYMECQLSALEEKELQYVLSKLPYSSPVIDEARESMIAEGLTILSNKPKKRPKFKFLLKMSGIAASLAILIVLSVFMINTTESGDNQYAANKGSDEVFIAYSGGKQLDRNEAEKAVEESMKKAEALMAMADARQKEDEMKQKYLMNLIPD